MDEKITVHSFLAGVRPDHAQRELAYRTKDLSDLLARIEEFIMKENLDQTQRKRFADIEQDNRKDRQGGPSKQRDHQRNERDFRRRPRTPPRGHHPVYSILTVSAKQILEEIRQTDQLPKKEPRPKRPGRNVDTFKWCRYHNDTGHSTEINIRS